MEQARKKILEAMERRGLAQAEFARILAGNPGFIDKSGRPDPLGAQAWLYRLKKATPGPLDAERVVTAFTLLELDISEDYIHRIRGGGAIMHLTKGSWEPGDLEVLAHSPKGTEIHARDAFGHCYRVVVLKPSVVEFIPEECPEESGGGGAKSPNRHKE